MRGYPTEYAWGNADKVRCYQHITSLWKFCASSRRSTRCWHFDAAIPLNLNLIPSSHAVLQCVSLSWLALMLFLCVLTWFLVSYGPALCPALPNFPLPWLALHRPADCFLCQLLAVPRALRALSSICCCRRCRCRRCCACADIFQNESLTKLNFSH